MDPTRPALALALLLLLALAPTQAAELSGLHLEELVSAGIGSPTAIAHAGDGRLFVVRKVGIVRIFAGGALLPGPFLDITDRVRSGGEQGLLSIAFHPDYAVNGRFFVAYTRGDDALVISRFSVSDDPDVADPDSEAVLLRIAKPYQNHNGGQLQFGPDGYLYVGTGDGGGAFDPDCNGQNRARLLGKILRLDVDAGAEVPPHYGIPPSNPFAGSAGRDEIWALGLRNPWRFSFDRATGDLYVGDVGQNEREEVDFQPASSAGGENYGWKVEEGDLCTGDTDACAQPLPACGSPELIDPVIVYDHSEGCSIIGGYVYRGSAIPQLAGHYLYGDFCTGSLWAAQRTGATWTTQKLEITLPEMTSFGEDAAGEIYLVADSRLFRLRGPDLPSPCEADATTLCLLGGRFEATLAWRTEDGQSGSGQAIELGTDAGYFWFFAATNPEVFVKLLDACVAPYRHFWVFTAGLTNVDVTLRVVDTATGEERVYRNPLGGVYRTVLDTQAFPTCSAADGGAGAPAGFD